MLEARRGRTYPLGWKASKVRLQKLTPEKYGIILSNTGFHLRLTVKVHAALHKLRFEEGSSNLPQAFMTKNILFVLNEKLTQNVLWMQLHAPQPVSLAELRNIGVVTYEPSYVIRVYGDEPNVHSR